MPNGHQLEVDVSDEDWRHARLIFSEFKSKPGSEYIATEFALAHLSAILTTRRPQTVLEFWGRHWNDNETPGYAPTPPKGHCNN